MSQRKTTDQLVMEYRLINEVSRSRELTLQESLRLQELIKQIDRRRAA